MGSNFGEFYLAHYGIKTQKWGIRRYQYKDGHRTPLGKDRYGPEYRENLRKEIGTYRSYRDSYSSSEYDDLEDRYDSFLKGISEKYSDPIYDRVSRDYIHSEDELLSFRANEELMKQYGYDPDDMESYGIAESRYLESFGIDPDEYALNVARRRMDFEQYSERLAKKVFSKRVDKEFRKDFYMALKEAGYRAKNSIETLQDYSQSMK